MSCHTLDYCFDLVPDVTTAAFGRVVEALGQVGVDLFFEDLVLKKSTVESPCSCPMWSVGG
jgi:hypothetical protein